MIQLPEGNLSCMRRSWREPFAAYLAARWRSLPSRAARNPLKRARRRSVLRRIFRYDQRVCCRAKFFFATSCHRQTPLHAAAALSAGTRRAGARLAFRRAPRMDVLDLSAAPAESDPAGPRQKQNTGQLVANEPLRSRAETLWAVSEPCVTNALVPACDGRAGGRSRRSFDSTRGRAVFRRGDV
jgi:hypothetical protein